MKRCKGIIFPRIAEEVVNYEELASVWGCSYQTAYRILHGICPANHIRKEKLANYLGIPVKELWVKADAASEDKVVETADTAEDQIPVGEILEG